MSNEPADETIVGGEEAINERSNSLRANRNVRFMSPYMLEEALGAPLQPIPSEQEIEDDKFGPPTEADAQVRRQSIAGAGKATDEAKPATLDAKRLRSSSSVGRKFRGTRHQSLLKPESKRYVPETSYFDGVHNDSVTEALDVVRPELPPPVATRKYRNRSQSAPPPPIPSLIRRMSSFPRNEQGRPRRPTISEAGVSIVLGVTDPVPHPGVMAATFLSAADIPGPKELIMRNASTRRSSVASQRAEDLEMQAPPTEPQTPPVSIKGNWGFVISVYLKMALKFVCTLKGFFITLYLCLVIAFGGMLFLILIGAAPAMKRPTGKDGTDNPGKVWIEIDSQVLNGLFCLTGFGLMPQRTKHLYILLRGQIGDQDKADISLVKRYQWYVPGLNWYKLAAVLYLYELNSLFQIVMAAGMWAYNRHNRPAWLTGVTIGLGFASSMIAGIISGIEARKQRKLAKKLDEEAEESQLDVSSSSGTTTGLEHLTDSKS